MIIRVNKTVIISQIHIRIIFSGNIQSVRLFLLNVLPVSVC